MYLTRLYQLLRVNQWSKNLLVFAPAFFGQTLAVGSIADLVSTAAAFCLGSSSVYVFNDLVDKDFDRLHKQKRHRPIASGVVENGVAIAVMLVLAGLSIALSVTLKPLVIVVIILYLIQNLLYSVWLKNLPLVDVTIVSTGFLLRIYAGGVVAHVPVSDWMFIMTFLLSMLLALGKRRDDLVILQNEGIAVRKSIKGYSIKFIDLSSAILGSVIIVAYLMYTISAEVVERIGSENVYMTSVFVLVGILRYLQLSIVYNNAGDPTSILLRDTPIRLLMLSWILAFVYFLYFK